MLKLSTVRETVKSLGVLRTSAGDVFSFDSAADALIRLSYVKAEIEAAEKAIKEKLPEGFIFENELGKITQVMTAQYSQDVPAIIAQLTAKGVDWQSLVKFGKTGLDKVTKAVIESNETKTGETPSMRVIKKDQAKPDFDFTLE